MLVIFIPFFDFLQRKSFTYKCIKMRRTWMRLFCVSHYFLMAQKAHGCVDFSFFCSFVLHRIYILKNRLIFSFYLNSLGTKLMLWFKSEKENAKFFINVDIVCLLSFYIIFYIYLFLFFCLCYSNIIRKYYVVECIFEKKNFLKGMMTSLLHFYTVAVESNDIR